MCKTRRRLAIHLREMLARTPTADLFHVAFGAHAAVLLPSILIWRALLCAACTKASRTLPWATAHPYSN